MELSELDIGRYKHFPFGLVVDEMVHSSTCFGYRFEIGDKVIAMCTDTGVCEGVLNLAKGADILMTECALKSRETSEHWPHLNPEMGAQMAKDAQVKQLYLMHFDAGNYTSITQREEALLAARKIFAGTEISHEGLQVVL